MTKALGCSSPRTFQTALERAFHTGDGEWYGPMDFPLDESAQIDDANPILPSASTSSGEPVVRPLGRASPRHRVRSPVCEAAGIVLSEFAGVFGDNGDDCTHPDFSPNESLDDHIVTLTAAAECSDAQMQGNDDLVAAPSPPSESLDDHIAALTAAAEDAEDASG